MAAYCLRLGFGFFIMFGCDLEKFFVFLYVWTLDFLSVTCVWCWPSAVAAKRATAAEAAVTWTSFFVFLYVWT